MKTMEELIARLREAEAELEAAALAQLNETRARLHYRLEQGRVHFESGIRRMQVQYRAGLLRYLFTARLSHLLTIPFIYSLIVPLLLLDLLATLYQHICFPIYGIKRVRHRDHMVIDRHLLAYLNLIEKAHCFYCSYANGLIEYVREIAALTEAYWCPIKHAHRSRDPHNLTHKFLDYGDAEAWARRPPPP